MSKYFLCGPHDVLAWLIVSLYRHEHLKKPKKKTYIIFFVLLFFWSVLKFKAIAKLFLTNYSYDCITPHTHTNPFTLHDEKKKTILRKHQTHTTSLYFLTIQTVQSFFSDDEKKTENRKISANQMFSFVKTSIFPDSRFHAMPPIKLERIDTRERKEM